MIYIIITSILMSVDLFMLSLLLKFKSVYIPIKSIVITIFTSSLILFLSIYFSANLKVNNNTCSIISGSLFIFIGIYKLFKKNKNLDLDNSKILDNKEAFALGILVSIDSIIIGISFGLSNYNVFLCIFISTLCNTIALLLPKKIKKLNPIYFEPICACLFIIIGILKIINHSS